MPSVPKQCLSRLAIEELWSKVSFRLGCSSHICKKGSRCWAGQMMGAGSRAPGPSGPLSLSSPHQQVSPEGPCGTRVLLAPGCWVLTMGTGGHWEE